MAAIPMALCPLLVGFDVSRSLVPTDEIVSGGPAKDGIPAILEPRFSRADDATLESDDRVVGVSIEGQARAYPLEILNWHEAQRIAICPLDAHGPVTRSDDVLARLLRVRP
jgi:hypothetical protein